MYDPTNMTFTVTFKEVSQLKPLAEAMRALGKGHKKPFVEQLIIKAALLVEDNPHVVTKIIHGNFDINVHEDINPLPNQ